MKITDSGAPYFTFIVIMLSLLIGMLTAYLVHHFITGVLITPM